MAAGLRDWALLAAFFGSGFAALGFELLWVRLLGYGLGAETLGVLAVLTGFFSGLALGAAAFHRRVLRVASPVRLYAACEILIAVYGVLSPWLVLRVIEWLPGLIGPVVGDNRSLLALTINFGAAALLLLPATVPMGVTTAALVEAWRRSHAGRQQDLAVGRLYAANTLGATAGIVGTTYWIVPRAGSVAAAALLGGVCLAAAALAVAWSRRAETAAAPAAPAAAPAGSRLGPPALYAALLATGLAGIGFEAVGTQVLAQIFENTVYTFANVLAVFLVGTSIGAWLSVRPWAGRLRADPDRATLALVYGLALSIFASAGLLSAAPRLLAWAAPAGASSYPAIVAGEALVTAVVFLLPTLLMGATFSHLLGQLVGRGVGYGYAVNTVGGALAPYAFGLLLVPRAGYGAALAAVGLVYLGLFAWLGLRDRIAWPRLGGAVAVAAALWAATYTPLVLVRALPGYRVVAQRQGLHGTVMVSERAFSTSGLDRTTIRLLQVNQNFLMGGAFGYLEGRIGHLALLLADSPRDVLFLGVGTGITAGAALSYPDVETITAVELVPEVLDLLDWFAEHNADLRLHPRVELHASDARRFLRAGARDYDLIVGELFHPTVNGAGALFSREHFDEARAHLRPGGLFVQWLPLYQLSPRDLATIVRTFLDVFPDAHALLGTYSAEAALGLFAWAPGPGGAPGGLDMDHVARRLAQSPAGRRLVHGEAELLVAYLGDAGALREYAGEGPLNTDLNPRILFDAPLSLGAADQAAVSRSLASLLPHRRPFPDRLLRGASAGDAARWRAAIEPASTAAGHFMAGEISRLAGPEGEWPAGAVDRYLAAYAADPGFEQARQMLVELAGRHPEQASVVLSGMASRNPSDAGIGRALDRLAYASGSEAVLGILREYLGGR